MSETIQSQSYQPPTGLDAVVDAACPSLSSRQQYCLPGPQVEPEASFWTLNDCKPPCVVRISDLIQRTDNPADTAHYFPEYPDTPAVINDEIEELVELASLRDDPDAVFSKQPGRERRAISPFLQYRPQPLGAIYNLERDPTFAIMRDGRPPQPNLLEIATGDELDASYPVIRTGRELARYFENETPGLAHHHALNYLLRDQNWSPPRQAWIWATLDITIYSALLAAWYYKWIANSDNPICNQRGENFPHPPRVRTSRRARPFEYDSRVSVLYNREVSRLRDGDGLRRTTPSPSPGTPRHPAYPSGHSTYGAAASELLAWFFPDYREELYRLADNSGMARLWAGIHWRSDHVQGMRLGRSVACMVIEDIIKSCIPRIPDCCPVPAPETGCHDATDAGCREAALPPNGPCDPPPSIEALCKLAAKRKACCKGEPMPTPERQEGAPEPAQSSAQQREQARSPQQGAPAGGATRSNRAVREQSRSPQQGAR